MEGIDERVFKLILPIRDNSQHLISSETIKDVISDINEEFGGSTIDKVSGCYNFTDEQTGETKTQCEENLVIETAFDVDGFFDGIDTSDMSHRDMKFIADNAIMAKREFINNVASQARKRFGQDSIYVEEDIVGDISFIYGKKSRSVPKKYREDDFLSRFL